MSPKDFREIYCPSLLLARTLREAEEGVTLNDKSWHVRKVTGARGTHAGGLGRVATAPDDDVDLGPDLGSGLISGTGAIGASDDLPSGPGASGEHRSSDVSSPSKSVSCLTNVSRMESVQGCS